MDKFGQTDTSLGRRKLFYLDAIRTANAENVTRMGEAREKQEDRGRLGIGTKERATSLMSSVPGKRANSIRN